MIARLRQRSSAVLVAVCLGVCFLAGGVCILLTACDAPAWLADAWPWGPKPIDPGPGGSGGAGGNGGTGGTGGGGSADPGDYVILADQVIRVPRVGSSEPTTRIPNPPQIVTRIPAGAGKVALTFDAGWIFDPTMPLLEILRANDLKVTFFPRAKWIEDHPDLAQAILADGHEIGSHSYTHPDMTTIEAAAVEAEISKAKQALIGVAGSGSFVPLYRPPYGAHGETVSQLLAQYGYGWVVMWQVDSLDWQPEQSADAIVNRVLGKIEDGGIVLMHIGRVETLEALPRILAGLAERNLSVVKVSELLAIDTGDAETESYTVKAGDTLYGIARKFETTVERLLQLNPEIKK